jgi:CRP-like cAMP-binding protein
LLPSHNFIPIDNRLLAALPAEVADRLLPDLQLVLMPLGKVIYEPGAELAQVYFPVPGCIVSMLYVMSDGASAEIAVVGDEGMVGIALFMGGDTTPSRALVQSAGQAFLLRGSALKKEFERHGKLQDLLLRYTQALITQMSQTAVCNRHHSVEKQLCRWLLLSLDRLPSNELTMTQELIANMLGVRREGVTEAAGKLQDLGLIHYSRGRITVLDRPGLETRVCECYAVVKKEYDRLLPDKETQSSTLEAMQHQGTSKTPESKAGIHAAEVSRIAAPQMTRTAKPALK